MEDLQSLMSCLDEISNVIGDGMYLSMANKLKRNLVTACLSKNTYQNLDEIIEREGKEETG